MFFGFIFSVQSQKGIDAALKYKELMPLWLHVDKIISKLFLYDLCLLLTQFFELSTLICMSVNIAESDF